MTWLQVEFSRHQFCTRVKVHNNMFLVDTKFNALSHGYKLSFFWGGPIALRGLVRFLGTTRPSLTKGVYAYFDRISYEVVSLCPRVTYLQYLQSCLQKIRLTTVWLTVGIYIKPLQHRCKWEALGI